MSKQNLKETISNVNKVIERIYQLQIIDGESGVYPKNFESEGYKKNSFNQNACIRLRQDQKKSDVVYEVPYNRMYRSEIKTIVRLLDKYLSNNSYQRMYIVSVKEAFISDNWDLLEKTFLEVSQTLKNGDLLWNIGPIESMSDKKIGVHRYYSSLLCEITKEGAFLNKLGTYIEKFPPLLKVQGFIKPSNVNFVVGDIISQAGEIGTINPSGWSRPESVTISKTLGTLKQVYKNKVREKFEKVYSDIAICLYGDVLGKEIISFMHDNYILMIALHEYAHTLGKFDGYRDRLGNQYNAIEEIKAEYIALLIGKYLEDKGVVDEFHFRNMILVDFVVLSHMINIFKETGNREVYYLIGLIFNKNFGSFLIKERGVYKPNFTDLEILRVLRSNVSRILKICKSGTAESAVSLVESLRSHNENLVC